MPCAPPPSTALTVDGAFARYLRVMMATMATQASVVPAIISLFSGRTSSIKTAPVAICGFILSAAHRFDAEVIALFSFFYETIPFATVPFATKPPADGIPHAVRFSVSPRPEPVATTSKLVARDQPAPTATGAVGDTKRGEMTGGDSIVRRRGTDADQNL